MLYDLDDLEQSILRFTEAIFLPLPWDTRCLNFIQIFFSITRALVHRANEIRRPEDVTRSIIYLRYLRGQSLEPLNIPPNRVTGLLVEALGVQVEMKLEDVRQDVEEMAALCLELLKSDIPTTSKTGFIVIFTRIVGPHGQSGSELQGRSDKVMECLREANVRLPDSNEASIALAWSLFKRFQAADSNDDYEEAVSILDKVIHTPGDARRTKHQEEALWLVRWLALTRFYIFGKPEHLEEVIYRTRTLLGGARSEHTHHSLMRELAALQRYRFTVTGDASGLQEAHLGNSDDSDHSSFQGLAVSPTELDPNNHENLFYENLLDADFLDTNFLLDANLYRITDGAGVEGAIEYCRLLLASSHNDSRIAQFASLALDKLLSRTNDIENINGAISILRDKLPDSSSSRGVPRLRACPDFYIILKLITHLTSRFLLVRRREDLNEIMRLYPRATDDENARTPDRFLLSREWARMAHFWGHPSTSAAYDSAISLMQDTLTYFPTVDIQHSRLVEMRDRYDNGSLPLDHASYHISMGQLPRAIENLERGRALLWSEMRGLRTSIDQIRAIDSHLADNFAAVNRNLEVLTFKLAASTNSVDGGRDDSFVRMDPLGRLVVQQRKLLDDRNKLISQIQALPGFETFLKSPQFEKLHSAASHGPVVIINHCRFRSDILILLYNSPPSLIPTADDFYDRANSLRVRLLSARKKNPGDLDGLDSAQYEDALKFVLKGLYELVGQPVIQKLNELGIPEQSRVWWCPTSVFCSLPLHAMGPIPSNDGFGHPQYFLDLYIPSYITTLSTLIESNNPGSHTLDKPSILLVSMPDASIPEVQREMEVVQATSTQVTTLTSKMATPTTVLKHLRDHRFVHIACHGKLEPGKPFGASFKLFGEGRLSLFDIVRSQLPEAEFAFLSACHTAELTEESIADEALHLAAAMQYCGFRSVVGTMWGVVDEDGPGLARNFYKRVFSDRQEGTRYYERTAEALRDAVKNLRRKSGMTLERWVNFVHYGA